MKKTTLELPDQLFREIKASAAINGIKIKDFVAEALMDKMASISARRSGSTDAPWMRGFGALADLKEENRRIEADIAETFEKLDAEDRA